MLLCIMLMSSGTVGVHMLPVIIGNVICCVLIGITSGRERWKVQIKEIFNLKGRPLVFLN